MARHAIWFGEGKVDLVLPDDEVAVRIVGPHVPPASSDPLGVVAEALDRPVAGTPVETLAREAARVTIVVPDATRRAGTKDALLPLVARLARARHDPRSLAVVVARGIHPAASRAEVRALVGGEVMDALRVVQSAPESPDLNASIGEDEELGDVRVHRLVAEADLVILTGVVLPHHLAGFGGGAKALVPGVAERTTVEAAHRLTLRTVLRPDGSVRSQAGTLQANPFREALLRVAERHGRSTLLAIVGGADGRPAAAAAGDVRDAHEAAARLWRERSGAPSGPPPAEADLVVVGAGPVGGRDLIQAHKALLEAAAWARPGAPIVWLARAPHGPGHPTLLPWFEISKPERHLAALRKDFQPYGLTAYSIRRIAVEHPVHVASDLSRDLLRPMGLLAAKGPAQALERAMAQARAEGGLETVVVLPGP